MDDQKIIELLLGIQKDIQEIRGDIKLINRDLDNDYKALHGNGEPGILSRLDKLEKAEIARNTIWRTIREWVGWIFAVANLVGGWWLGRRGLR